MGKGSAAVHWEEEPAQVSQWKIPRAPCRIVLVWRDAGKWGVPPGILSTGAPEAGLRHADSQEGT